MLHNLWVKSQSSIEDRRTKGVKWSILSENLDSSNIHQTDWMTVRPLTSPSTVADLKIPWLDSANTKPV